MAATTVFKGDRLQTIYYFSAIRLDAFAYFDQPNNINFISEGNMENEIPYKCESCYSMILFPEIKSMRLKTFSSDKNIFIEYLLD